MTYRIDLPTMVLAFRDNHEAAVTIPAGTILDVIGPAEDDRFVVVSVDDEQFHMFASDLADRGKQIEALANADNVIEPNEKGSAHGTPSNERRRNQHGNETCRTPRTRADRRARIHAMASKRLS
ncbi:MAG: hypothetical protein ABSB35_30155 [Bryobacteraceae bacterium]|jgi:hypothetical protein